MLGSIILTGWIDSIYELLPQLPLGDSVAVSVRPNSPQLDEFVHFDNIMEGLLESTEKTEGWWEWLVSLKSLLNIPLFTLANTTVTLMSLVVFILLLTMFVMGASYLKKILRDRILPRFVQDEGLQYTLARMSQYSVVVIGILVSFQFLGVDFTGLAVIFWVFIGGYRFWPSKHYL